MGFTLPMILTIDAPKSTSQLSTLDYLGAALLIGFILTETVADEQQWAFQQEKKRQIAAGKGLKEPQKTGFIRSGLWVFSRHPNYCCEQAIWVSLYIFSIAATGRIINWSLIGSLLLILLFKGSADFSEAITAKKYPAYADYQRRTAMFIPYLY
jgi:steroid 5-alpha reductase family enzyme